MTLGVIIPCFNSAATVDRLIASLDRLNIPLFVVAVDNNSTDETHQILNDYCVTGRIQVVLKCQKKGVSSTRNIALRYLIENQIDNLSHVTFLDSDDQFLDLGTPLVIGAQDLTIFSSCETLLSEREPGLGETIRIDEYEDQISEFTWDVLLNYVWRPNRYSAFTSVWGKIYSLKIIKENRIFFNEKMFTYEDVDFNFRYLRFVRTVKFSSKKIIAHSNSRSRKSETFQKASYKRMFGFLWAMRSLKILLRRLSYQNPEHSKHTIFCYLSISLVRIGYMVSTFGDLLKFYSLNRRLMHSRNIRNASKVYNVSLAGGSPALYFCYRFRLTALLTLIAVYKGKRRY
jgi:glycosyltransferase involved in cell wall biosynthesis